jgi:hypothetical protein
MTYIYSFVAGFVRGAGHGCGRRPWRVPRNPALACPGSDIAAKEACRLLRCSRHLTYRTPPCELPHTTSTSPRTQPSCTSCFSSFSANCITLEQLSCLLEQVSSAWPEQFRGYRKRRGLKNSPELFYWSRSHISVGERRYRWIIRVFLGHLVLFEILVFAQSISFSISSILVIDAVCFMWSFTSRFVSLRSWSLLLCEEFSLLVRASISRGFREQ